MIIHHESIIDADSFDLIKSGAKRLKFYLNDTKRQGLKSGDFIKYAKAKTDETIVVSVKNITIARDSIELSRTLALDNSVADYINTWFSHKDQAQYGLLAVEIERVES